MLHHQTSLTRTEYAPVLAVRLTASLVRRLLNAGRKLKLDYWLLAIADYETDVFPYLDEESAAAHRQSRGAGRDDRRT